MRRSRIFLSRGAAGGIALLALSGAAPLPGDAPISDWSNIETVVVTAKLPGPALWHVVKGNSEVWILATVQPLPEDMKWESDRIRELLKGTRTLLLPPRAQVGLFEGAWFLLTGMGTLEQPDGVTLEGTLPEPLRSRFVAERMQVHQDADRYEKYLPAVAALMLESDFWKASKLNIYGPQRTLEKLAALAGVPTHPIATYPAMDVIHDIPKMSRAAHLACLDLALSDIAIESEHAVAAAQAWAEGDVAGIKANFSETKLDACLQQNNAYAVLRERAIGDMTRAIGEALNTPGKSFAVVPMGTFLRKGGVLDRLQASGLTITGPGD